MARRPPLIRPRPHWQVFVSPRRPVRHKVGTYSRDYDGTFLVPIDDPSEPEGDAGGLDQGTIIYDGGFEDAPTFNNQGNGKRAGGTTTDFAKFLFSIGAPEAGAVYTMTYDPDFTQLSQQGKLAMVGFGFKQNNRYHFPGLRGDGGTGLNAYKVSGNNFNNLKAPNETDGGAATHGTQAGPNWLQIEIGEGGDTYTLRTSSDGETWADEFTDDLPAPLSEATDATDFGIALYLDGNDVGAFTVDITLWVKTDFPLLQLDSHALQLSGENLILGSAA